MNEKYPWLEQDDPRRNMSDRKILDKHVDLDKSCLLIHVKEEDKNIWDKEMKRWCYLDILKEGFSAYSSPVMLISRKVTKKKRVFTDFRHLNVTIAKNNFAYLLFMDAFSVLGSSRC